MTMEELKKKPLLELKAMVYDCMAFVENNQQNIRVLNQVIAEKANQPIETEKKEE